MPDLGARSPYPRMGTPTQESAGWSGDAALGTSITMGSGAYGNWTQLIASTTKKAVGLAIYITKPSATGRYLIDIGIGAALSETALVPKLFYSVNSLTYTHGLQYIALIEVPAGSRLSARGAGLAADTIRVAISLMEVPD